MTVDDERIPFVDRLRDQLVAPGVPEPAATRSPRRPLAVAAAVALLAGAVGAGVALGGDDDGEVEVGAPAGGPTPLLAGVVPEGLTLVDASPWGPGAGSGDPVLSSTAQVWVAPGDGPPEGRPSVLVVGTTGPTNAEGEAPTGPLEVRGHPAQQLDGAGMALSVDTAVGWDERPDLALGVAGRGVELEQVTRVAEALVVSGSTVVVDPASLPVGWTLLGRDVPLISMGGDLPFGPGGDGWSLTYSDAPDHGRSVLVRSAEGGGDDVAVLRWMYRSTDGEPVRGRPTGSDPAGDEHLVWQEDADTVVLVLGLGAGHGEVRAIAESLHPVMVEELLAAAPTTTTTPEPVDASRPLVRRALGDDLGFTATFEPGDPAQVCGTVQELGGEAGSGSCTPVSLDPPEPVTTHGLLTGATPGEPRAWWSASGWVDPTAASVRVRLGDGTTLDVELVELMSRSSFPFPGNLWYVAELGAPPADGALVVEAFDADGRLLTRDGDGPDGPSVLAEGDGHRLVLSSGPPVQLCVRAGDDDTCVDAPAPGDQVPSPLAMAIATNGSAPVAFGWVPRGTVAVVVELSDGSRADATVHALDAARSGADVVVDAWSLDLAEGTDVWGVAARSADGTGIAWIQ